MDNSIVEGADDRGPLRGLRAPQRQVGDRDATRGVDQQRENASSGDSGQHASSGSLLGRQVYAEY
ncbi:hypothetical protein [Lentzea sp. NPDC051838]|uniref:hypothetical protein n=1 Tax=Lentzea sp. NPDC051838 TaxID=3154849 RepID=UPI003416874D